MLKVDFHNSWQKVKSGRSRIVLCMNRNKARKARRFAVIIDNASVPPHFNVAYACLFDTLAVFSQDLISTATMSGAGLSYGLNITKKQPIGSRPAPGKRKPIFDEDNDSGGEESQGAEAVVEEIGELGGLHTSQSHISGQNVSKKSGLLSKPKPGALGVKKGSESLYGDLSTSFTAKKHVDTAEELDASIYDYDAVYDSMKPQKKTTAEDIERKPKYMSNLLAAAAVRKRDATIAEEKKLAREREAEGEEFADKEKFVTSAYKKQQEENRRLEEEERIREEQEQKKNKGTGMTNFFKGVLEKGEQKHAEIVKAAEERAKAGPIADDIETDKERSEAEIAKEINKKKAGAIAVNDEGQVVDKRQLLKGGLNILPKQKSSTPSSSHGGSTASDRTRGSGIVGAGGSKQAMRERQSRMMEAQLEAATKRALEEEEEERLKVERAAKSRKTEGEIMNAKERYLARKREAEEAKKKSE
jgi:coiled-coil domain-containing protein 55